MIIAYCQIKPIQTLTVTMIWIMICLGMFMWSLEVVLVTMTIIKIPVTSI